MHNGFRSKLPLLLTFCLFTSFLPASGSVLCPAVASDEYYRVARNNGRDGRTGTDGRSGRSGENQNIFVNGSPVNLDLSGKDGEDGEDGEHSDRPDCGYQRNHVSHDINAANGGNGGNGGKEEMGKWWFPHSVLQQFSRFTKHFCSGNWWARWTWR